MALISSRKNLGENVYGLRMFEGKNKTKNNQRIPGILPVALSSSSVCCLRLGLHPRLPSRLLVAHTHLSNPTCERVLYMLLASSAEERTDDSTIQMIITSLRNLPKASKDERERTTHWGKEEMARVAMVHVPPHGSHSQQEAKVTREREKEFAR